MCYVVGRSSLLPSLPQRSPCLLSGAVGATCWRPGFVLGAAAGAAGSAAMGSPAASAPGGPFCRSRGTRGHRVPLRRVRGEPGEAALGAVWLRWQRQAHGTLQLCIPVGYAGFSAAASEFSVSEASVEKASPTRVPVRGGGSAEFCDTAA